MGLPPTPVYGRGHAQGERIWVSGTCWEGVRQGAGLGDRPRGSGTWQSQGPRPLHCKRLKWQRHKLRGMEWGLWWVMLAGRPPALGPRPLSRAAACTGPPDEPHRRPELRAQWGGASLPVGKPLLPPLDLQQQQGPIKCG